MLTHPTLDQLKALKLDGMADAFVELQNQAQAADLAHAEWLALLLDREAAISCFSDYREPGLALQQQPQAPAHDIMIIR